MVCDGDYVVPRNGDQVSKYPSFLGDNQTCAFFGSKPGNTFVQGDEYLKAAFNIDSRDLWRRNFLVLLGMFLFFQVAQALALEKTSVSAPAYVLLLLPDLLCYQESSWHLTPSVCSPKEKQWYCQRAACCNITGGIRKLC